MALEDIPANVPQNTALWILLLLVIMVHKRVVAEEAMTLEKFFWACHV